jgi:hypothetical protein
VLGFLHALMMQINEHMTFDEDPTNSGTSAVGSLRAEARGLPGLRAYLHRLRALRRRAGALRRRAFPALRRQVNQQAGHAWAEAFVPDLGWVGFDPANGICTTDAHARVAIGLDYPRRGAGARAPAMAGGMETLSVAVKSIRPGGRAVAKPVAT